MKLFYRQYGEKGPPLFILHGIFGMLDNWHNIARMLGESFTVYTIDARNHGQSPHSDEMDYILMARDTVELADDLGLAQFHLLGHSMGGKTAMTAALHFPDRISSLIVADIAPKAYKAGHLTYFDAFEKTDWSILNSRKEVDEALQKYETNPAIRLFLAKNIERRPEGGFMVKSNMPAIRRAYPDIIGTFQAEGLYNKPAMFITGEKSAYVKEEDKTEILAHFPQAVFRVVEGAGHWLHADNPERFVEFIRHFLK